MGNKKVEFSNLNAVDARNTFRAPHYVDMVNYETMPLTY